MEYLVNVLLALLVAASSFWTGKRFADNYNDTAAQRQKEALERQYMRLRVHMDADDPCKPYVAAHPVRQSRSEVFKDKELLAQFENQMKENGQATALLNKNTTK